MVKKKSIFRVKYVPKESICMFLSYRFYMQNYLKMLIYKDLWLFFTVIYLLNITFRASMHFSP